MRIDRVLRWAAFCAAVVGLGLLSASLRGPAPTAPIWPAGAVILAFALRETSSLAGRAAAVALGLASVSVVGLVLGRPPALVIALACCNALEIAIGLSVLRRAQTPVLGAGGFVRLVAVGSLVAPAASTAAAAAAYAALRGGGADVVDYALRWFAAHALGMMVTAPVLLSLGSETVTRARGARIVALQAAVVCVNLFAFTQANPTSLFLVAPLMALAVFMGGEAGAAITLALTGLTAAVLTALGFGPAAGSAAIYVYQGFLACLAIGAHALVALVRVLDGYSAELGEPRAGALWRGPAE